jgi:peptidoglycan/xylan/chitin deacetylase (PgdA/CDA1 family)
MKKFFFIVVAIILLLSCFFLFWLPEKYTVPVIMFHQVEKIDNREPNWVSPENFEFQMAFLKKNGFKVISLDQLVEAIKAGKKLSRKSVVLTFDDGYENNYTNAYPILKKYGYTATIFLISDLIDTKGYVTSKEVEEMYAGGCRS